MDIPTVSDSTQLGETFSQQELAYRSGCLRVMEVMLMQMQQALLDHPHTTEITLYVDDRDFDPKVIFYHN